MQNPIIPKIWSNPQSTIQFMRAVGENVLNIIPTSSIETDYANFPNRMRDTHVISEPDAIKRILRDEEPHFPKSKSIDIILAPVIDQSIFITQGDQWRKQHKQMIGVFNWRNIQAFETPIKDITQSFLEQSLHKFTGNTDITKPMQDLTFQIIAKILVGTQSSQHLDHLREIFERYLDRVVPLRLIDFFTLSIPMFPNSRNITERKLIREFKQIGNDILAERLAQNPPETPDFLEHLFNAFDYRNAPTRNSRDEIRDNLVTFIVAGHETTAMTLSWALYAAGFYTDAQNHIKAEAHLPLSERVHTEAFLNETMRIYPAAPMIARKARQKCEILGANIRKEDSLLIPIISMHRHRKHWDNPDEFIPKRFMNGFKPAPYTFLPFGAGPRICIGMAMAMMEAKIILPAILERITISQPTHVPEPQQILTLRSKNGIKLVAELQ